MSRLSPVTIVVLLGLAAVAAEAASKPNILVIFADDMVGLLSTQVPHR